MAPWRVELGEMDVSDVMAEFDELMEYITREGDRLVFTPSPSGIRVQKETPDDEGEHGPVRMDRDQVESELASKLNDMFSDTMDNLVMVVNEGDGYSIVEREFLG